VSEPAWAREAALAIWWRLAAQDYAGWDPYDALNARYLPSGLKNARFLRRPLTQAVKRFPVPIQPLLGVKRQVDPYTLGHVLLAAARLADGHGRPGNLGPEDLSTICTRVVAKLRTLAHAEGDSLAWGYHFPVHTRFFSYVPPTPNLIVTAFVAKGLAAVTRAGLVDCSAEVRGAATFVLEGLPRVTDATGQCIGYVPGETTVVHNANMLAALVLCEAAEVAGTPAEVADIAGAAPGGRAGGGGIAGAAGAPGGAARSAQVASWLDEALACARFTVARQAADGSWRYSEEAHGRWVDGFHTGFVLEGLARVARATGDPSLQAALTRGVRFYVAQLFGPNGEPKYYPHKARPFDALAAAQGVETLQVALSGGAAQAVPGQLDWIRRYLVRPGGQVAYQVHRGWADRREFPRWASAPLMSALAGVPHPQSALPTDRAGAP
jgi:polysaccharide biosynthesis protein VpsJ